MITVHGRWVKPDGTPAVGRIGLQLAPPGGTYHAGGWVQTDPAQIVTTPTQWADLVDGEMQMSVMASDDPSWHQSPRGYVLVVDIDGQPTTMGGVLLMSPGPIDLADVTPMPVDQHVMVVPVPGPANRLTVDAVTVDPDQDCTATISGDPPTQHIRFGLAQGMPGKPGPATALTVDAVTVDPDQDCTATISGDPPKQHIRFGLARGAPGQLGPHAESHEPGGSDPIMSLAAIGNLMLSREEAACDVVGSSIAQPLTGSTVSAAGGRLLWTAATAQPRLNLLAGPGSSPSSGSVAVQPGETVTMQARARSASGRLACRVYWFDVAGTNTGNLLSPWSAMTADWATSQLTAVAPAGAVTAGCQLLAMDLAVGQIIELDDLGVWYGAGGEWRPPGQPIPGLGTRITYPAAGGWVQEKWIDDGWLVVDGDTGKRAVGNGHCQRVANMVTWTATDVTPPTDWRPALGVQPPAGCAYLVPRKWPSTYPGSPAR